MRGEKEKQKCREAQEVISDLEARENKELLQGTAESERPTERPNKEEEQWKWGWLLRNTICKKKIPV